MTSKFDKLREGLAIEIEPGLSGKLNRENKTLELSSGKILNVADDNDFFPSNEKELSISRKKEKMEKKAQGTLGEFTHQFTSQGLPGSFFDIKSYLSESADEYAATKDAERQVSKRISKESPWTSAAATGANIGLDIAATRGMSALKAAPLLTAASSGSRLFTEPGDVAAESAMAAGLGFLGDKATDWLGKVSVRRGESQSLPFRKQAVKEENFLGKQAVDQANLQNKNQFNLLKQETKAKNEAILKSHNENLVNRKNQIISDQNDFLKRKAQQDSQVLALKNQSALDKAQRNANQKASEHEYKLAKSAAEEQDKIFSEQFKASQRDYDNALEELPNLQKKAQEEYSRGVVENANKISKAFSRDAKINTGQFDVNSFVENSIQKTGLAGSSEAKKANNILKSIFPENEVLSGKDLAKRYKALEDAISRASPEVKGVLNEFKQHMGGKLNKILSDNIAFKNAYPTLRKQISNDIRIVLNKLGLPENKSLISNSHLKSVAEQNIDKFFKNISPENFVQKIQDGSLKNELMQKILSPSDFRIIAKNEISKYQGELGKYNVNLSKIINANQPRYDKYLNDFSQKIDIALEKAYYKTLGSDMDATRKLGGKVRKTFGIANEVEAPFPPAARQSATMPEVPQPQPPLQSIQYPPELTPPKTPQLPPNPVFHGEPVQPTQQSFNPQQEPFLSAPSNMAHRTGDFLEKNIMGGRDLINNPFTKLAGLKYALGSAALPVEAGYGAMKLLTSPGKTGEMARMTFKQGGIQAILGWAEKYPSFHEGILENPMERRSLTKEIENDFDIPIEQKALIQSKINRGIPIQNRL